MKQISKPIPKHLDVGFEWDAREVWKVEVPITEIALEELLWHFNEPFWNVVGTDDFNLTPYEVIKNPDIHNIHYEKILKADLLYPVDVMLEDRGRLRILDGIHRVAKAYLEGKVKINVRLIPVDQIPRLPQVE